LALKQEKVIKIYKFDDLRKPFFELDIISYRFTFSPDSKFLAISNFDKQIEVYHIKTQKRVKLIEAE
jgi:WD40 repeat protein